MSDLKERLRTMADMISLCEKISWGSDSAIMREAAARIEELEAEVARLVAEKNRAIADNLEADLMREKEKRRAEAAEAKIEELEIYKDKLRDTVKSAFFEGFAEGRDGTWIEGDPTPAYKISEVFNNIKYLYRV